MPAWITSLLRELVSVPMASARSRTITSSPAIASRRAQARPITPAPITTQSTRSITGSAPERPVKLNLAHTEAGDGRQDVGQASIVDRHALGQATLARPPLRLTGQQDLVEPGCGRRSLDPFADRRGLSRDTRRIAHGRSVQDEGKHAVENAVLALVVRGDGGATGHGGAQYLAQDGEARALVGAEGEQGALTRVDVGRGIGGGPPVLVDQGTCRDRHALVAGDPRLTES